MRNHALRRAAVPMLCVFAFAVVTPARADCPPATGMSVSPASLVGGSANVTVQFATQTAATNCRYNVTSTNGALAAPVGPVLGNGTQFGMLVSTQPISGSSPVTITLTGGQWESGFKGQTHIRTVTLSPIVPTGITAPKSTIRSGETMQVTVSMNTSLMSGKKAALQLSRTPQAALVMPGSADASGGGTSAKAIFNVTGAQVSTPTQVTITATRSGVSRTATITVEPAPPPVQMMRREDIRPGQLQRLQGYPGLKKQ